MNKSDSLSPPSRYQRSDGHKIRSSYYTVCFGRLHRSVELLKLIKMIESAPIEEVILFLKLVRRYGVEKMVGVDICDRCRVHFNSYFRLHSHVKDGYLAWCERCQKIFDEVQGFDVVV